MSGSCEIGEMTERERLQLRLMCIEQANRFDHHAKPLDKIMEAAERFAAFVFQTGAYAEKDAVACVTETKPQGEVVELHRFHRDGTISRETSTLPS